MTVADRVPLIFDLRRFALDDGPGIRTTVFVKGCPLSCVWCHNPESVSLAAQMGFRHELCLRCGDCAGACQPEAISPSAPGEIDRGRCSVCGACSEACPTTALRKLGEYYPVPELLHLLRRDRLLFETSGGGVTFSGGEPTLHLDYLAAVARGLKQEGIHLALQTCGFFDFDAFCRQLLPFLDLVFFDLKLADPALHRRYTGQDNALILENFRQLRKEAGHRLRPRVPLVPGITATGENLSRLARFLRDQGIGSCELLPYNPGGLEKRRMLRDRFQPPQLPSEMMPIRDEKKWTMFFKKQLGT